MNNHIPSILKIIHFLAPACIAVSFLMPSPNPLKVLTSIPILFLPLLMKEKRSGFTPRKKILLEFAIIALIALAGYFFTDDSFLLICTLVMSVAFLSEWKFSVFSNRYR